MKIPLTLSQQEIQFVPSFTSSNEYVRSRVLLDGRINFHEFDNDQLQNAINIFRCYLRHFVPLHSVKMKMNNEPVNSHANFTQRWQLAETQRVFLQHSIASSYL